MIERYRNFLLASNASIGTANTYCNHMFALQRVTSDLLTVDVQTLEEFLATRRQTHMPETRKSFRSAFRSFYSWAHQRGLIQQNPTAKLQAVRVPKTVARLAPDDALQLGLLTAPIDEQHMILAGRMGCLRLSEITNLHTEDRHGDVFRIVGKGGKVRNVPINDDWMPVVLKIERENNGDHYLPGRWGGALHVSTVSKKIQRRTGCNPHSLRHAGATAAYEATGDLRAVQELLGHESLATTEKYLHTSMQAIRRAAAGTTFSRTITNPTQQPRVSVDHALSEVA